MTITIDTIGAIKVVRFPQQMHAPETEQINQTIQGLLSEGNVKILCDLAQTEFFSETGLTLFINTVKQVHAAGGQMAFCKLTPPVRERFVNAGLTHIYKYYDFGEALQLSILKELSLYYSLYADIHEIRLQRLEDSLRIDLFMEFDGTQKMSVVQQAIHKIKTNLETKIKGSEVCIIPTTADQLAKAKEEPS